ncbi:hypothetical protein C0993_007417 [Termitomyces sp. T159_Od127]|nr:hypothetical protein C0993_007417 [Termitomyces sp. T159_Od127]
MRQCPQPHSGKDIPPGGASEKGMGSGGEGEGGRGPSFSAFVANGQGEEEGEGGVTSGSDTRGGVWSDKEDKACCLDAAIETSKVAPRVEDFAGSSRQVEAPQDIGAPQEEMEQEEEEAKPAVFLERMRAQAAQIERLLAKEREAVRAELMGLYLQYSMLWQSVETLCNYQEDVTQALEWQEENNVQEGDLLSLRNPSLPSDDD